jgi:hypothetical protein
MELQQEKSHTHADKEESDVPLHPGTRFPDIQSEKYDSTAFVGICLNELCNAELEQLCAGEREKRIPKQGIGNGDAVREED